MTSLINFFTHKFFKVLLVIYLTLFTLIWLVSSPIAKHYINPVLADYNLQLSDDASIRFNPFLMRVTLSDIKLSNITDENQTAVLAFEDLTLQVALWQLALDRITLSEFSLSEGMIKISQHDEHLVIAGVKIPATETPAEEQALEEEVVIATEKTQEANEEASTQAFNYQLVLPDFLLSQFHIEIERNTTQQKHKTHHITIEQLALNQVKATQTQQEGNFALSALIDKTHLSLTANTKLVAGKGDINSTFRLDNYPLTKLTRYVEQLTELNGTLALSSQQTISLLENGMNLRIKKANFGLQDIYAQLAEQNVMLDKLQYNFADLEIDLQENKVTHLAGESNIKLTNASFNKNDSKAKIAAFKTLDLADIKFVLDEEPSIDIADIVLDEFTFSKQEALTDEDTQKAIAQINKLSEEDGLDISAEALVKLPPVLELKQLTLNHLHIHEKSIAINSIIFDSLTGDVIIKPNKDIANLVAFSDKKNEAEVIDESNKTDEVPTKEEEQATEQVAAADKPQVNDEAAVQEEHAVTEEAFVFSLNELRFINENNFGFTDFSVDPIYQRTLYLDKLEVGEISNSKEKQQEKTPYSIAGRSNKYANFKLDGYIQPFTAVPTYHVNGHFKEFSLPAISTYMKDSTGLEVKTGQLNLDFDVDLKGEEIDGNVNVLLQALETALVDEEEAGNLISQGALPLNMAMGMLKDSDGNVELDVPLSGSTSDPEFGLSSIVTLITQKAILSATQDYLMTTFVPYANVVSIAITAGEFALKLRFDDLEYAAKQIEPNESQNAYLKEFIALMQEKEDTRVTICAYSTPADIDLKLGVPVKDKAAIKRLIEIGEKREHGLKDYLIEHGKINSSRILFCKPQIDTSEDAVPRIAISV